MRENSTGRGILDRIVESRRRELHERGYAQGILLPEVRDVPVVPFGQPEQGTSGAGGFVICEVKRRSPSRGEIDSGLDAVSQAARYASFGVRSVSVLTEERHFGGSLADLTAVKRSLPHLSVLRKDFLLDLEDIEVSYRAGADAVLLIASVLSAQRLRELYERSRELGLSALVELHSEEDVEKVRPIAPPFVGFNSRDLSNFTADPVHPVRIASAVTWNPVKVYESGIDSRETARFASAAGFDGILVGEAAVRRPDLVPELASGLADGLSDRRVGAPGEPSTAGMPARSGAYPEGASNFFWTRLYAGKRPGRPLVKICGLTTVEDALLSDELGADILGFVLAPSPRRTTSGLIRSVGRTHALKVAVAADPEPGPGGQAGELRRLLEAGEIDAVQFHGRETPDECAKIAFPYYKAVGVATLAEVEHAAGYRSPRVLFDMRTGSGAGGTGRRIPDGLVGLIASRYRLWLAGGIGPDSVGGIIGRFAPELVDASSRLESIPGRKDPEALARFFREIDEAAERALERDEAGADLWNREERR